MDYKKRFNDIKSKLLKFFSRLKSFSLDILFPIVCIACDKPGKFICDSCFKKIPLQSKQVCPICEQRETPAGQACFACRNEHSIDGILAVSRYRKNRQRLIAQAVHYFKYRFIKKLGPTLAKTMKESFLRSELPIPDFIIPVPLHPRRLRWRGFNQAEILAKYLSDNLTPGLEIPLLKKILVRSKYTPPQMNIKNYRQRQSNLKNAFEISPNKKNKIYKKNILLVDDISTTGSTLFECAKELKKAGAKKVFGIIIARQEQEDSD